MASRSPYRFQVALSFAGAYRARVEAIARFLAKDLGPEKVLYDHWYREEMARPNLDVYLTNIYHKQSRLLVFFLSKEYADRQWTGLEWRAARDLLKHKEDDRLMFLRLDDADIPGLYSNDGYVDIRHLSNEDVAADILKRLNSLAPGPRQSIEAAVQDLRDATASSIRERCGKIRVLSMEQPIALGSVFTAVKMLDKRTLNRLQTKDELLAEANSRGPEHLTLAGWGGSRLDARVAFENHDRVIVYGKPGAGKTTLLKHLAMECITGDFRSYLVPAFVTLRDYAERADAVTIAAHIQRQWRESVNATVVMDHGYAMVLLDGLDEVHTRDFTRVRKAIEDFAVDFPLCKVVITCRIAAREYAFENFAEVEMADFDEDQINEFAARWFTAHHDERKARTFTQRLHANKPMFELATNPLLLTLLCLVFQERNDFEGTRADLYKQGLDIILYRWDARRDVERELPTGLTKAILEPLLIEIAYTRFISEEYFFEQQSLEAQIRDFFLERYRAGERREIEPSKVLNSIESHIGLLVARAANVYSFSHLTFQEYLTALQAVRKPSVLLEMGKRIGDRRWREVWLLLATMLDADDIMMEMKVATDLLVSGEHNIQEMLRCCARRAARFEGRGNEVPLLRALYYQLELVVARPRDEAALRTSRPHRSGDWLSAFNMGRLRNLARIGSSMVRIPGPRSDAPINWGTESMLGRIAEEIAAVEEMAQALGLSSAPEMELDIAICRLIAQARLLACMTERDLRSSSIDIDGALARVRFLAQRSALARDLPAIPKYVDDSWIANGLPSWLASLQSATYEHCQTGFDWSFDGRQLALLEEYHFASQLLLECMDAASGLTVQARDRVKLSMLLPYEEILPIGWMK